MITLTSGIKFFTASVTPSKEPDVTGYVFCAVLEASLVNGTFTPSASNQINVGPETSFTHKVASAGTYYVRASAYDSFEDPKNINYGGLNWTPVYSVVVSSLDPLDTTAPDIPTGLALESGLDTTQGRQDLTYITASWNQPSDPNGDLSGYSIQLKRGSEVNYVESTVNSKDTLSVKFSGLIANTSYSVRVSAFDKWGNISAYSSWVSTTTTKDATIPPDIVLTSVTSAFKNVFIEWTSSSDLDIDYYQVEVATNAGFTTGLRTFKTKSTTLTVDAVSGTTYYVRVKAVDYSENTSTNYSNVLNTTTALITGTDIASLTLTATNIANGSIDLGGTKITGLLANSNLAQITDATKIADSLIGNTKLAALAVDATKLADSAVTATKIASAAVGTAAIANAAITNALIANAAVGSAQIVDLAVTTAKIAALAVGSSQIADAAITNAKIGLLAVNTANIADAAIATAKIADLAVDAAKIANATITTAKIGDAQITNAKIDTVAATKITTGALSATSVIDVGTDASGTIKLSGTNNRIEIRKAGEAFDRVQIGKLASGYGIEIKNSSDQSIFDANGNIDGLRVSNLAVTGTVNVGGNLTIGGATITFTAPTFTGLSDKPTTLSGINSTEGTKLSGIAEGATKNASYSQDSGSPPASPNTGDFWYQTDTFLLKRYDGAAWVTSGSYGAKAGTNIFSSTGTTLGNSDIITSEGTAANSVNLAGTTGTTVVTNASNGATAYSEVQNMSSDGKLTPVEKQAVRTEWNGIYAEKQRYVAQATSFGITTEQTNYTNAYTALADYLNAGSVWAESATVPPSWIADANLGTTTDIVGATFRDNFKAYYDTRGALIAKLAAYASTTATWSSVSGTGKPADNADVTTSVLSTGTISIGAALQVDNYLEVTGTNATVRVGRSSFDTAVTTAGLVIGKEGSTPKALFYKDASNYLKYDSSGVVLRGSLVADDITSGAFKGGKTGYSDSTAGFFLGYDSSTPKFNIGNSTDYLKWTGTGLDYTGTIKGDRIIRGRVNSDGTIANGTGFTITKNGTGSYDINFSTAFSDIPTVVVTGEWGWSIANIYSVSSSSARIYLGRQNFGPELEQFGAQDTGFSFLAIGTN